MVREGRVGGGRISMSAPAGSSHWRPTLRAAGIRPSRHSLSTHWRDTPKRSAASRAVIISSMGPMVAEFPFDNKRD
jgi:hypothetical protein